MGFGNNNVNDWHRCTTIDILSWLVCNCSGRTIPRAVDRACCGFSKRARRRSACSAGLCMLALDAMHDLRNHHCERAHPQALERCPRPRGKRGATSPHACACLSVTSRARVCECLGLLSLSLSSCHRSATLTLWAASSAKPQMRRCTGASANGPTMTAALGPQGRSRFPPLRNQGQNAPL